MHSTSDPHAPKKDKMSAGKLKELLINALPLTEVVIWNKNDEPINDESIDYLNGALIISFKKDENFFDLYQYFDQLKFSILPWENKKLKIHSLTEESLKILIQKVTKEQPKKTDKEDLSKPSTLETSAPSTQTKPSSKTGEALFKEVRDEFYIGQVRRFFYLLEHDIRLARIARIHPPQISYDEQLKALEQLDIELQTIDTRMFARKAEFNSDLANEYKKNMTGAIEKYRKSEAFLNMPYDQHAFKIAPINKHLERPLDIKKFYDDLKEYIDRTTHDLFTEYREHLPASESKVFYFQILSLTEHARDAARSLDNYLMNLDNNRTLTLDVYEGLKTGFAILQNRTLVEINKVISQAKKLSEGKGEKSAPSTETTKSETSAPTTPVTGKTSAPTTPVTGKTSAPTTPVTGKTSAPTTPVTGKTSAPLKKPFFTKPGKAESDSRDTGKKLSTVNKLPDSGTPYKLERPNKFISKHNVNFIQKIFEDNKHSWKVQDKEYTKTGEPMRKVLDEHNHHRFDMYINKLTTPEEDDATFFIMLETFKGVHQNTYPKITTNTSTARDKWVKIFNDVYPDHDQDLDALIIFKNTKDEKTTPTKKH